MNIFRHVKKDNSGATKIDMIQATFEPNQAVSR